MFIALLLSITILLPGLFVVINKRGELYEWLFLALSFFLSLWSFTNFLVDNDIARSLLWTRFTFFAVVLASIAFFEFAIYFPEKVTIRSRWRYVLYLYTLLLCVIIFTPLFITGTQSVNSVVVFESGPLYGLFLLYYPIVLLFAIYQLIKSMRNSSGVTRDRVKTVLTSIASMAMITSTTNLILPEVFHIDALVPLGGYATIIFTLGVAYAMLRHHLFDIRAAAARATTYLLSLSVIVLGYTATTFLLSSFIENATNSKTWQSVSYGAFIVLITLLYQPTKSFFDKVTNRVFFRDSYEPQSVLDSISEQLVGAIDVTQLLSSCSTIISNTLKPNYCAIILSSDETTEPRVFGSGLSKQVTNRMHSLVNSLQKQTTWPILLDELEEGNIRTQLRVTGVYFAIEMRTRTERLGFIVLGEKKSGNIYSTQDVGLLSIVADDIALGLENALRFEQIEDLNQNLQHKIDVATRELRSTNNKLKALDQAKDEFISMASHQLRTPLTSIKGYLSMVLEGDAGAVAPQQKEMLETAFTSAQRMVYLISDLLNVSRLQTGKFVIEPVESYLPDVVEQELSQLKEAISAKKIKLEYKKPKDFPKVKLDETKIRQVIMNFADNALYYTPTGGKVLIELSSTAKSVQFTVTDNGIGVPKAEQAKLFTKFYRADNARKARPDGTGLGLFMAKKVIVASGGSLIFRSKENAGSTFGFTFPRK